VRGPGAKQRHAVDENVLSGHLDDGDGHLGLRLVPGIGAQVSISVISASAKTFLDFFVLHL
jgi:hypothetical protein